MPIGHRTQNNPTNIISSVQNANQIWIESGIRREIQAGLIKM